MKIMEFIKKRKLMVVICYIATLIGGTCICMAVQPFIKITAKPSVTDPAAFARREQGIVVFEIIMAAFIKKPMSDLNLA